MNQTDERKFLPYIEINNSTSARNELTPAVTQAQQASAEREKLDAAYAQYLAVERDDHDKAQYARTRIDELTEALRMRRVECNREILELREASDAYSLAQEIRKHEDTLALFTRAYAELVEVQIGLNKLKTAETLVSLNHAKAIEADQIALVLHIQSVIALEPLFQVHGRIGFVGEKTEEARSLAKELHRIADLSEDDLRESRASYQKQQTARISTGIITSKNVTHAIGH